MNFVFFSSFNPEKAQTCLHATMGGTPSREDSEPHTSSSSSSSAAPIIAGVAGIVALTAAVAAVVMSESNNRNNNSYKNSYRSARTTSVGSSRTARPYYDADQGEDLIWGEREAEQQRRREREAKMLQEERLRLRVAEQRAAEQRAAVQRAAEQRAAEQRAAEQRAAISRRQKRGRNFGAQQPKHDQGRCRPCRPCRNYEKKGCCYVSPQCHYCHDDTHFEEEDNEEEQDISRSQVTRYSSASSGQASSSVTAAAASLECHVCFDAMEKVFCIVPCGHAGYCQVCVTKMGNCPMCRRAITGLFQIHL